MKNILPFLALFLFPPAANAQTVDTFQLEKSIRAVPSEKNLEEVKKQLRHLTESHPATTARLSEMGLEKAASPTARLTFLETLTFALLKRSKFGEAEKLLDEAEALAEKEGLRKFLPTIYLYRGNIFWKTQKIEEGLAAADQCGSLAAELGDGDLVAKSQMLRGWLLRLKGENEKAIGQFNSALDFFEKNKNGESAARALNGLAATHYLMENLAISLEYYLRARDYASQNGLTGLEQNLESNMGYLYLHLEEKEKARAALFRAFRLAEKSGNRDHLTHASFNLGELYLHAEKPDSARLFSELALKYAAEIDDKIRMAGAHMTLADLDLAAGLFEAAAGHARQAVAISEASGDVYTKGYSLFQQGQIAERQERYREALSFFGEALQIFEQTGELGWQSEATKHISQTHEKMGSPAPALDFFKKSQALRDSIQAGEQKQKIAAIEKQFEVEKKEEEIRHLATENELLEANGRKNRFVIGALALALALAILAFVLAYRQRKLKLEKGLAEVKQQLLRQQMNPHFIFNALNSVQNQFLKGDAETSVLLMGKFSKLMRLVLSNSNETFVPIHDEVELLRLYLDLEQIRTDRKFEYAINIDEEVDIYNVRLPSMIAQIFVENAIWHGIAPKTEKGKIILDISKQNGSTTFSVEDNGVGRKYSLRSKTESQKEHRSLGTHLVRERIRQINRKFAQNIRLLIEDLSDPDGMAKGTKVELVF